MDAALDGIEPIPNEDKVRRNLFAPHMATPRTNVQSIFGYENAFEFKSGDDGRMESVIWDKYCTPEETLVVGEKHAQKKRDEKLARDPDLSAELLPSYAGYFEAEVGLIRASAFVGRATAIAEARCVPGVYEVVHFPEHGLHAHAHIVLLDTYIEAIKTQMRIDQAPGVELMGKKLAFPAAVDMLLTTMEAAGFFCHDGDHIPSNMAA